MTQTSYRLPTVVDVEAAAGRLAGVAVRTPLLSFPALDARAGARVFVKPETLQLTGSFKFRGAYNKMVQIAPERRAAGVVAWSSGNHAQGVAMAARLLGMPATIVMPADAPQAKLIRTAELGAEVVTYDRVRESREEIGTAIASKRGAVIVPPFDDFDVIAGQGTVGLEIAADLAALGVTPTVVTANTSGGGLIAGIALAIKSRFASARVVAAEPADFDDHIRSFRAGTRQQNKALAGSFCDALLQPEPGELTFELTRPLVGEGVSASDAEIEEAIRFAAQEMKLVVEPGGAVTLAALLKGRLNVAGGIAVIVLSGGNIDRALLSRILAG